MLREILHRSVVPHALLFVGPKGVGKATTARLFAAAYLCPSGEPDGCASCRQVLRGVHPDFHLLECEGTVIRLPQILELERELARKPVQGSRKAAVVDEAHLMNREAANTFLKTLEEPPEGTCILLVTEAKEKLPPTVVSRCTEVRFGALGRKEIEEYLVKEEGLSPKEAERLARLSGGIFGRAVEWARYPRLADFWMKGVEVAVSLRKLSLYQALEEMEEVEKTAGGISPAGGEAEEMKEYLEALDKRGEERLRKLWRERKKREETRLKRRALYDFLDGMSSFYRDIMLLNLAEEEATEKVPSLINEEIAGEIEREAAHLGTREALRGIRLVQRAREALDANVDVSLVLEDLAVELRESGA
jgi:DNA polymerase-3 subunit delta'